MFHSIHPVLSIQIPNLFQLSIKVNRVTKMQSFNLVTSLGIFSSSTAIYVEIYIPRFLVLKFYFAQSDNKSI